MSTIRTFAPLALRLALTACGVTGGPSDTPRALGGTVLGWEPGPAATVVALSLHDGAPVGPSGSVSEHGLLSMYLPRSVSATRLVDTAVLSATCPDLVVEPVDACFLPVRFEARRALKPLGAMDPSAASTAEPRSLVHVYASKSATLLGSCTVDGTALATDGTLRLRSGWNVVSGTVQEDGSVRLGCEEPTAAVSWALRVR